VRVCVCVGVCVCLRVFACVCAGSCVRVGTCARACACARACDVRARMRVRGVLHESRRYLPMYGIYSFRVNFCSLPFTYTKKGLQPLLHEQAQWSVRYLHVQVPVPAVLPCCKKIFKSHWICMRHCTDMYLLSILNILTNLKIGCLYCTYMYVGSARIIFRRKSISLFLF
jgi:hypothetical protein